MPINIDELTTEVIAEPEASRGTPESRSRWEEVMRMRSALSEFEQDRRRLAAEDAHE